MNPKWKLPLVWDCRFPTPPAQRYYGPLGVWGKNMLRSLSWQKISHVKFLLPNSLLEFSQNPIHLRFNISMILRLASVFVEC